MSSHIGKLHVGKAWKSAVIFSQFIIQAIKNGCKLGIMSRSKAATWHQVKSGYVRNSREIEIIRA